MTPTEFRAGRNVELFVAYPWTMLIRYGKLRFSPGLCYMLRRK